MSVAAGTRFGAYEIVASLGAGGMGEVYRARDTSLHRDVAVKILTDSFAADPDRLARFAREAQVLASLNHPHIAQVYGLEGSRALVMELVDGPTLAERLGNGALPVREALRLGIQLCEALDAAHRQGIVHRDIKPANVMLTRPGGGRQTAPQAKLLDFGLAKPAVSLAADATLPGQALTAQGTILGTIQYMSPEQIQGRDADPRSDIFAFGAVLYEMLTGRRPFDGDNPAAIMAAVLDRQPAPVAQLAPGILPRLAQTVMACLEKDPQDRWQSARDLVSELRWCAEEAGSLASGIATPRRVTRRDWLFSATGAFVAAAAAVAWRGDPSPVAAPPVNPSPVIVLMDSQHPQRVYDDATRKAGGTNADDLTDLLRDLPVVLLKENTGPAWHREDQILRQNPDVILIHRSCFYDATMLGDGLDHKFFDKLYAPAADKLELFLAYIAAGNPRTRVIVYSRGSWNSSAERDAWVAALERRFPALRGRVAAWRVPLDRATFRHPVTGAEFKKEVRAVLSAPTRG